MNLFHRSTTFIFYFALCVFSESCRCGKQQSVSATQPFTDATANETSVSSGTLFVDDLIFSSPNGPREKPQFGRAETVTCTFRVRGFTYQNQKAHLTANLSLFGLHKELILEQKNISFLEGMAPTLRPGTIWGAASFTLPSPAPAGDYELLLEVIDHLANRRGKAKAQFFLWGMKARGESSLKITQVNLPGGNTIPRGSVSPIALTLEGLKASKTSEQKFHLEFQSKLQILSMNGKPLLGKPNIKTVRADFIFAPVAFPFEQQLELPTELSAGNYLLQLTIVDFLTQKEIKHQLPLQINETNQLGIANIHVHDTAHLPREQFLLGEQAFIRFSIHGLRPNHGLVQGDADLAIAGPDGGIYLAVKKAVSLDNKMLAQQAAQAGRFPVQIPIVVPQYAPTGTYRLVFRVRDSIAKKEITAERTITISGPALRPLSTLTIDRLEVRERPNLPSDRGDTFSKQKEYFFTAFVGGAKFDEKQKMHFYGDLQGDLQLRDTTGRILVEKRGLFRDQSMLLHPPLRLPLKASLKFPDKLPLGLYDLEISVLNKLDNQVSQLTRRIEIVP